MTELSFLLELLLNHELPKPTQLAIKDRLKAVEESLVAQSTNTSSQTFVTPSKPFAAPVIQPEEIGQTQAAQAALALRQQIIAGGAQTKPQRHLKG